MNPEKSLILRRRALICGLDGVKLAQLSKDSEDRTWLHLSEGGGVVTGSARELQQNTAAETSSVAKYIMIMLEFGCGEN